MATPAFLSKRLQKIYESGLKFSIDIMAAGVVMAYIKDKHGYPKHFDTLEEAINFLWKESGLELEAAADSIVVEDVPQL